MTNSEIRDDVERSLSVLDPLVDEEIRGYRAPSFSLTESGVDVLADLGLTYDSSVVHTSMHDRYGAIATATDRTVSTFENGLVEVAMPSLDLRVTRLPWGGGGYFRVAPYPVYERGVRRIGRSRDFVFYLHPWELDPGQPRRDLSFLRRHRHYTNIDRTAGRLDRLLGAFDWQPIQAAIP
jgi:polysaccharide deacetylase family protein (PEP-CTERM system associated)